MTTDFKLKGTSDIWYSLNATNQIKLTRSGAHIKNATKHAVGISVTGTTADGLLTKTLPIVDRTLSGNYHKTNRPKVGLGDVEIRIGDQYGMLLKATVNFTVYDLAEFVELERIFLRPNNKVDIHVEYLNGSNWDNKFNPNVTGVSEHNSLHVLQLTIFKFKHIISDTNTFVCTFECMGSANMLAKGADVFSILDTTAAAKNWENDFKIRSPIDVIFYNIVGDANNNADRVFKINTTTSYYPKDFMNNKLISDSGRLKLQAVSNSADSTEGIIVYPNMPDPSYLATKRLGWRQRNLTDNEHTGIYITLGYLVNVLINTFIMPAVLSSVKKNNAAILKDAFVATVKQLGQSKVVPSTNIGVQYICSNEYLRGQYYPYLCSGDPMKTVWLTNTTDPTLDTGNYSTPGGGYNFNMPAGNGKSTFQFNSDADGGGWVDLTKILINVDEIVRIFEYVRENKEIKDSEAKIGEHDKPTVVLSIHDFLKKIFALIKSASGGLYDINLIPWPYYNEEELRLTARVLLVNTKYINTTQKINKVLFDPLNGDDVTMVASTTMEIPNDAVAMNAYATNMNSATSDALSAENSKDDGDKHRKAIATLLETRMKTIPTDNFKSEAVDTLRAAVTDYVNTIPKPVIQRNTNIVYPLKLNIEIDGINGFKFGDIVSLDHLHNLVGYEFTVFRTLAVVHTISNNAWKSVIESICDLSPEGGTEYSDAEYGFTAAALNASSTISKEITASKIKNESIRGGAL